MSSKELLHMLRRFLRKRKMENASTFVSAHALIVDKDASAVMVPALEIESVDVQAGHSASVTTLDEEQLFYLAARGIPVEEARRLIVKGFLLEGVEDERVEVLVDQRWQASLM